MNLQEMFEKYQALLVENQSLKDEINSLKAKLGVLEYQAFFNGFDENDAITSTNNLDPTSCLSSELFNNECEDEILYSNINSLSEPAEKIKLFMSLFKGREDVFAKRWENKNKGTAGYSPFCLNECKSGLCRKPKGKCTDCIHKAYAELDEKVVGDHLRGRGNFVAGIYPLLPDETCYFLAIDFDAGEWQKDISVLREACMEFNIPAAIERSRSGKGAHAWFFFESAISAAMARKFGSALLTYSMSIRHEITFKSYDRFFPNQDTLPKGGLGNLIALPLQKAARNDNNSVFIDDNLEPFNDQWSFMATLRKLSEFDVEMLTLKLCNGNELGVLKKDDQEEPQKPWETNRIKLTSNDYPQNVKIVKANMLFILKTDISQRGLNHLNRLAAFKNPEFYKAQAMRMPTFDKPRIISCADETAEYLCLPRGCEGELLTVFSELEIKPDFIDETNHGKSIDVDFNGSLRDEQPLAINKLLMHDIGVLSGTTAFGKTVVAIKLIAERKVNTLILVDKTSLVAQWKKD